MNKKTSKFIKVLSFCLALYLIFLMSACTSANKNTVVDIQKQEYSKEIEKFIELISSGNYTDALEYYVEKIALNTVLEQEAKSACSWYYESVNQKYLNGTIDRATADMEYAKLNNVMENIHIMTFVPEYESELDSIKESKDNYELGISAYESKNYITAINYLKNVVVGDCNYDDSQTKLASSKEKYKESVLNDAKNKAENELLSEAIKILNDSVSVLGDDTQIKSKIDEYGNIYVNQEVEKAEKTFVNPKTDWETALNIIKSAQQYMPNSELLKNKRNYYENYKPVSLFDMHLFEQSNNYKITSSVDNMGNIYENSLNYRWTGRTIDYYTGADATKPMRGVFILDKKYNTLNFIVAVEKDNSDYDCYMTIRVYGDDHLLFDAGDLKRTSKPQQKEIDVTGITELKVCIDYNGPTGKTYHASDGRKAIFANPMLQRTMK